MAIGVAPSRPVPTSGGPGGGKATSNTPKKAGAGAGQGGKFPAKASARSPQKAPEAVPPRVKKPPRTAAVVITCGEGGYAETMRKVQSKVDFASLGIEGFRGRGTLTGALVYEVPGEQATDKTNRLACGIVGALGGRPSVKVSCPVKHAEMRLTGLDVAATPEALVSAIASAGGCGVDEVRVAPVRAGPSGALAAWARCPLAAVSKIIVTGGRVRVGWVWAHVSVLEERPLQCFKCLEGGHVRTQCSTGKDRADRCYQCSEPGHLGIARPQRPIAWSARTKAGETTTGRAIRPVRSRGGDVRGSAPLAG